jgi:hypothetical protein
MATHPQPLPGGPLQVNGYMQSGMPPPQKSTQQLLASLNEATWLQIGTRRDCEKLRGLWTDTYRKFDGNDGRLGWREACLRAVLEIQPILDSSNECHLLRLTDSGRVQQSCRVFAADSEAGCYKRRSLGQSGYALLDSLRNMIADDSRTLLSDDG